MPIRQPIVCVLGHIDVGKTLLLDKIRESSVQAREAGGITQHIGASFFPLERLIKIFEPLSEKFLSGVKIPGLLIIDTPGHEAFANLRKRGGSVADIAILVIDVLKGFEPQTYECVDILKARKTPFIVAVNKIDRIPGWASKPNEPFLTFYETQNLYVRRDLDDHLYKILGTFSELGFRANRFDKISEYTRTVAVIPVSAKTGEGVLELLAVLVGLTQQYLQVYLKVSKGPAKGTVLEVKEDPGLGTTLNVIIYDGILRRSDTIVVGGREKPIITKVRALLLPKPLDEIRDPREKFSSVKTVSSAAGVKIAAQNLEDALAGAPLYVVPSKDRLAEYVNSISEEVTKLRISTDIDGIVIKTDTLGSLEAICENLRRDNIPIRLADVGDVTKRDVTEALVVSVHEPLYGVVLAFNVKTLPDAKEEANIRGTPIFQHNVIFHLINDYMQWMKSKQEARLQKEFNKLIKPGKMQILSGHVFRRAKPAVVGIKVLAGQIRPRRSLMGEDGSEIGEIIQIQDRGQAISEAKADMQVAISIDKAVVGRHINEGDVLYVKIHEVHAKTLLTKFSHRLSPDEMNALREFVDLMKRKLPFWSD